MSNSLSPKFKTFFLDQHGCAKNQVDGELLITCLEKDGWTLVDSAAEATLILINSCGFIQSSKEESLKSLFEAKSLYPNAKILLCGCLAERYAKDFKSSLPEADGIFGNGDISKICSVVDEMFKDERPVEVCEQKGVCCGERNSFLNLPGSAYIKITEGCDNICSFCAIPIIRGRLRSKPIDEIVGEIKTLLSRGVFEFNLIGQDLASYGLGNGEGSDFGNLSGATFSRGVSGSVNLNGGKSPLGILLEKISEIEGDFWIRLLYIHPDNFPLDILEIIKSDKRILPYFDIPFQSGDDDIIKAMNRHGNQKDYVSLVQQIRNECSKSYYADCAIRTTFLCGFPCETESNAENTQHFLHEIQSDWSGCFAYSREEDTAAYSMKNQVPSKKAQKRSDKLNEIQTQIMSERLKRHVGEKMRLLVEEIVQSSAEQDASDEQDGIAIARAWFQAPDVDGAVVVYYDLDDESAVKKIVSGKTIDAEILGVSGVDLFARYSAAGEKADRSL